MLYFDAEKFDFWKIYETIRHFYPIGVENSDAKFYRSYPGQIELDQLLSEKIHDQQHFQSWVSFTDNIAIHLQKEIIGTTNGQSPAYSSVVQLETNTTGNLTRNKEITFFVSILGPYYTIIGQDTNEVRI